MKKRALFNDDILVFCRSLETEYSLISPERRKELQKLGEYIKQKKEDDFASILFLCKQNIAKSHLAQIWLAVAADYYDCDYVKSFSGGFDPSYVTPSMIHSLMNIGFQVDSYSQSFHRNPYHYVSWTENSDFFLTYSKKYSEEPNPKDTFASIFVCDRPKRDYPQLDGSELSLSLVYDNPANWETSNNITQKYYQLNRQIGREMLYVLHYGTTN